MATKLIRLINRPFALKNRISIPINHVKINNINKIDSNFLVDFNVLSSDKTKVYNVLVLIDNEIVDIHSKVEVRCSCESFKYQFETNLAEMNALYGPPSSYKHPKKNIYYICKHVEICLEYLKRRKKIK